MLRAHLAGRSLLGPERFEPCVQGLCHVSIEVLCQALVLTALVAACLRPRAGSHVLIRCAADPHHRLAIRPDDRLHLDA
jgi:hypothetical protein